MTGWEQAVPNHKDGTADITNDRRPTDPQFFTVGATFVSPDDEHYYGLGDNHEGFLDHRGHPVRCWNDYNAPAAPTTCVPFLLTNKGYGLIWDNPSKTMIEPGFNEQTEWSSEVGDRVSFFVIAGNTADEIYDGYRLLTGPTPLLPKAAYGYIQCKQRYSSQEEVLAVAKGYRDRHLPADVMVVDWFYYTKMGQMDMDPKFWPDPVAMNKQLHDMGFETMISVWPRFVPDDRFYADAEERLVHPPADGKPIDGLPYDRAGSDIDTTNPDAAKWYWNTIRDNILSKGFDSLWADETEPDLPPNGSYYHIGPGTQFFNVYPLFHTGALSRRLPPGPAAEARADSLARCLPGRAAQRNDRLVVGYLSHLGHLPPADPNRPRLHGVGNHLLVQRHRRLAVSAARPSPCASAAARPQRRPRQRWRLRRLSRALHALVSVRHVSAHHARARQPQNQRGLVLRQAGRADPREISAPPLPADALHLLARLPDLANGAPFMRALPLDFPNDPNVADLRDEYMFGPAFLVAPVTSRARPAARSTCPPAPTGTTTGPMSV